MSQRAQAVYGTSAHHEVGEEVGQTQGIVRPEDEGTFAAIVDDTVRLRDSRVGELVLLRHRLFGGAKLADYQQVYGP